MSVRVGRRFRDKDPQCDDYVPVVCLSKSSRYGCLSPYLLKNEQGMLLENVWQFGKIYERVPASRQHYSRFDKRVIWEWPAEVHWDATTRMPTDKYWNWRCEGMRCSDPVRYPVGYYHRSKCVGYVVAGTTINGGSSSSSSNTVKDVLGYVDARKQVYLPIYLDAVRQHDVFKRLQQRLSNKENLLVIEVDGPHQESLEYYKSKYGVADDFIVNSTMLATKDNLRIMLEDDKHPFGHGYCLAAALLNIDLLADE